MRVVYTFLAFPVIIVVVIECGKCVWAQRSYCAAIYCFIAYRRRFSINCKCWRFSIYLCIDERTWVSCTKAAFWRLCNSYKMNVEFVNQSIELSFFFVCTKFLLPNLGKFSQIPMMNHLQILSQNWWHPVLSHRILSVHSILRTGFYPISISMDTDYTLCIERDESFF